MPTDTNAITAGGAIFVRLKKLGIDYVFCNSGTDFPPIIEGLAEAGAKDIELPQAIVIPHEHAAMGMAHGYYHTTGKAQAVMLHTNVGLANGAIGAINAAHENIPILLMSGRTPITEQNRFGTRTVPIGWGQEMRDQTALIRESTKWDYELRFAEQITEVLDRASAIAQSTPKGPVYLSLPRETLCETIDANSIVAEPCMAAAHGAARPKDIDQLAKWIAEAGNPVMFCQRGAGSQAGFESLTQLADEWALPVNHYWAVAAAIPTDHPMNIGSDPTPWVENADLIIVINSLAPWSPAIHKPRENARIVHIGPDPLFSRTPIRNFHSSLSIAGETGDIINALARALVPMREQQTAKLAARHKKISAESTKIRSEIEIHANAGKDGMMTKAFVAKCLSDAITNQQRKASVTSELGCPLAPMIISHFNGYRQEPHSGGLGYGLPAALGIQLAEPNTLVFATMGDGSYIFSNPTACHQIAEALALPIITLILNNEEWGAVRQSVTSLYPEGYAAKSNVMPLTALQPSPDFTKTAEASGAYTETITKGDELPGALERAIKVASVEKRQVLFNIKIGPDRR